jgi:hypothetical protein
MEVPVKVERQSGLFSTLGYPESVLHLPRFLAETQLLSTPAGQELSQVTAAERGTHLALSFRGLAQKLKDYLAKYDVKVIGEQEALITLVVNELHCPRVPGATGRLTVEVTEEESSECSLEILGVGGGDEFTLSFTASDTLEAENNCVAASYSFPAVWEKCQILTGDGRIQPFVRLKDINQRCEKVVGKALDVDACTFTAPDQSFLGVQHEFDLTQAGSLEFGRSLSIEVGSKFKEEFNIKFEKLELNASASYIATKKYKTELEYNLKAGHRYTAFRPQDSSKWLWKVST